MTNTSIITEIIIKFPYYNITICKIKIKKVVSDFKYSIILVTFWILYKSKPDFPLSTLLIPLWSFILIINFANKIYNNILYNIYKT